MVHDRPPNHLDTESNEEKQKTPIQVLSNPTAIAMTDYFKRQEIEKACIETLTRVLRVVAAIYSDLFLSERLCLHLKSLCTSDLCLDFNQNEFSVHKPLGSKIQVTLPIVGEFQCILSEAPNWNCSKCGELTKSNHISKLARQFLHFWEREHLGVNPDYIVVYQQGPVIGLCKYCQIGF